MQQLYILSLLLALWLWRDAGTLLTIPDTMADKLAQLQSFNGQSAHDSRLCG